MFFFFFTDQQKKSPLAKSREKKNKELENIKSSNQYLEI
jgi:hypothetical protein